MSTKQEWQTRQLGGLSKLVTKGFSSASAAKSYLRDRGFDRGPFKRDWDGSWVGENYVVELVKKANPSPRYRKTVKRRNPATSDKQVIKAFTEQRAASSSRLHTDGRRLDGLWMGGNGIAVWEGGKIHLQDLGSNAARTVQRAVVREAPRSWFGAGSEWAFPRKRKNPPSSGLGGTYAIMHANPFGGPLTITHDGPDLVITHKANPRRKRSVAEKISSSRIPWHTMTASEIEAVRQEAAAAGDHVLLKRLARRRRR